MPELASNSRSLGDHREPGERAEQVDEEPAGEVVRLVLDGTAEEVVGGDLDEVAFEVAARGRADEAYTAAGEAATKADTVEKASKRLVYEVVLSEDKGNFKFGRAMMPDEAKAEIDTLVQQLKSNPNGGFIEIEGHTDNAGSKDFNQQLGLDRAENVKRYLYEQHQVPLHKINVISYGEEKPVAPNKTKAGRAQNRRVVIKVLV